MTDRLAPHNLAMSTESKSPTPCRTTNYNENSSLARTPARRIYQLGHTCTVPRNDPFPAAPGHNRPLNSLWVHKLIAAL